MKKTKSLINRRGLLRTVMGGTALAAADAAQEAAPARAVDFTAPTRRMDELTSREIEFYLQSGGDLVLIPFGPVSGHGALIPVGMHCLWAHAVSVLVAEGGNGLVFPPTYACYAGATRTFRGTVSFPHQEQVATLKRIASTLHKQGFRRTVLVGGTNPEDTAGMIAARELFDETEQPYWFVSCSHALNLPEVRALYAGYPGNFGETQLCLAALRVLGRGRPIPMENWAREKKPEGADQPAEITGDVNEMRRWGAVGFRYYEEGNHGNHGNAGITFRGRSDIEIGVDVLKKSAEAIIPALARFGHYAGWLEQHPVRYVGPTERLNEK